MFRSLLFIPGNNPSMLQNADVFSADAIIFDLEDAISISEKNNARNLVRNYLLNSSVLPKQIILRVNAIDSEWFHKDIEILKTNKIDYLLIPKMDKMTSDRLTALLSEYEAKNNIPETKVIALVETARGVEELPFYAENKRLIGLFIGAEDLANDLEIKRTETGEEIFYARSKIIYQSVINHLIPIDTPYTNINNPEGLLQDSTYAMSLGMKAKACIHPNQLDTINKVFSPSPEEIKWAQEIIKINLSKPGHGVFQYQGKMIDKPIISRAEKIIEKAKIFELL